MQDKNPSIVSHVSVGVNHQIEAMCLSGAGA